MRPPGEDDDGGDQVDHARAGLVLLGHVVDCTRVAVGRVEACTRNVKWTAVEMIVAEIGMRRRSKRK